MTTQTATTRWPRELRLKAGRRHLQVTFEDGFEALLPAELLRAYSPSAEVQGHGAGQKVLVVGTENVTIRAIERVGSYAVRLIFDDGHDTGFYTWAFLDDFARTLADKQARYEEDRAAHQRS